MDGCTGKDLLKTFQCLDIDLGKLNHNVIEAMFDTDCLETLKFLKWLTMHLGEENIVSVLEIEKYETLAKNNLVLSGQDYECALNEINSDCPGLFDEIEDSIFEIEYLEDEKTILLEEEKTLDDIIFVNKELNKKLSLTLSLTTKEEVDLNIVREKAENVCLQLSQTLHETNLKLHEQIMKCSEKLNEFEYSVKPAFISNMPMESYNCLSNDLISQVNLLIKEYQDINPKMESTIRSCKKLNWSVFENNEMSSALAHLKDRVFKSVQNKNYKEINKQELISQIKYLEELNITDLMSASINASNIKLQLELGINSENDKIGQLSVTLENKAHQASENFINLRKIDVVLRDMETSQDIYNHLLKTSETFGIIFSYHILCYLMFMCNQQAIKDADKLLRAVHTYITYDLQNSVLRTTAMTDKINEHNLYKNLPFEQRSNLVKAFGMVLSDNTHDTFTMKSIRDMFKNFEAERKLIETELFWNEFLTNRKVCKDIQYNSKILITFLQSSPTVDYECLPYKLYKAYEEANEKFATENRNIKLAIEKVNNVKKQMSENKWLQMYIRLWIHFITEPKKVISSIQEIEVEVKRRRNKL